MAPPTFANFGKATKDLFKKGYEYKNEAKFNAKASSGAKLETGVYQGKKITVYGKGNFKLASVGDVEVEVHTNETVKAQIKLANLPKGASSTFTGNIGGDITGDVNYSNCSVATTTKASHNINKAATNVSVSAAAAYGSCVIGAGAEIDPSSGLKDANAGCQYSQSDLTLALYTSKNFGTINASYNQKVSSDLTCGGLLAYCTKSGSRSFTLGGAYSLDRNTAIKAKGDNKGNVGVSVAHTLNDNVSLTVGSEFDSMSGDAIVAQKMGLSVQFNY